MPSVRKFRSCLITATVYAWGVCYSILVSRYGGGIAMVWVGGAVLAGRLVDTRDDMWPATLACCVVTNALATGLIGLGWVAAVPLAIVNVAEAGAAALIFRALLRSCWPRDSLELVTGYYLGIGLVVPLCGAIMGTLVFARVFPSHVPHSFFHWFIGHAVGLILASPLAIVIWRIAAGRIRVAPEEGLSIALQLGAMALLTYAVFTQSSYAALALPLVFTAFVAWYGNAVVATSLPVVLGVIGGRLSRAGHGPFQMLDVPIGDRMQLFALYASVATLCALPLICERVARAQRRADFTPALD